MPNLFAMSFEGTLAPSFDLRCLHPGRKPPDGWGIGYYPGGEPSASVLKEPAPENASIRSEIVMMRTPDGHGKLELSRYDAPAAFAPEPENPPPNTLGLHRVMFAVDDIDDTLARLRAHGGELLREVGQYENMYRLCYLRGPAGIIVALAERIG